MVKQVCFKTYRDNSRNPVTKAQANKIVAQVTGKKSVAKVCGGCQELEGRVEELENFIRSKGLVVPTE